jgi:ribulose-5-phosphate 4-epimerase/fuculose-1-phosphate aldolase
MADPKAQLISLVKKIGEKGLTISTGGNASTKLPEGRIVITPSKHHKSMSDLEIGDLSIIGPKGELMEGPKPSVELPMHLAIYSVAPSVSWVLHAHTPLAIAYASEKMLPETSVIEMSSLRLSQIGREEPGTEALASAVASEIKKGSNGVFMESHGVVVVSSDANDAYLLLQEIENACKADLARKLLRSLRIR